MVRKPSQWTLSPAEKAAAQQFIEALRQRFPALADGAEYGPGYEGTVYVYSFLPDDEDEENEILETVSQISADVLAETNVMVLLMRAVDGDRHTSK